MKDYAVQIKIKNNFLLERMRLAGFGTASSLAKAAGVSQGAIGDLLNLKTSGLNSREHWRSHIVKIAECLRCLPEDLIPQQHHRAALARNSTEMRLSADEVQSLMLPDRDIDILPDTPLKRAEVESSINRALHLLPPREEKILRLRFGFDGEPMTLEEVGKQFGVSKDRVRQIEVLALRKIAQRDRVNSGELKSILQDEGALP